MNTSWSQRVKGRDDVTDIIGLESWCNIISSMNLRTTSCYTTTTSTSRNSTVTTTTTMTTTTTNRRGRRTSSSSTSTRQRNRRAIKLRRGCGPIKIKYYLEMMLEKIYISRYKIDNVYKNIAFLYFKTFTHQVH